MRVSRPARLVAALSLALLSAYAVTWVHLTRTDIGRSDFTSTYVGATLLREGHRGDLYSDPLQASLHAQVIAPDRKGNLPFVDAPMAAAVALPVSLLGLDSAYRVWGLVQLAVLALAVVIALRSAPWPAATPLVWKVAAALAALAGVGTFVVLVQAQWTPVTALGLALAYHCWRRGRLATGAALLVFAAAVAKPHLALALLAFMLGWRDRRLLGGALAGAAAAVAVSALLVGPAGIGGFLQALTSSATRWDLDTFVSFVGIGGVAFGNGVAAQVIGIAGGVGACAVACWLGSAVRRDHGLLEPGLAAAAVLSLLAAPHALLHDLALLAPVAAWTAADAVRSVVNLRQRAPAAARRRLGAVVGSMALISAAGLATIGGGAIALAHGGLLAPGATVAPALLVVAGLSTAAAVRQRSNAPRVAASTPSALEFDPLLPRV